MRNYQKMEFYVRVLLGRTRVSQKWKCGIDFVFHLYCAVLGNFCCRRNLTFYVEIEFFGLREISYPGFYLDIVSFRIRDFLV